DEIRGSLMGDETRYDSVRTAPGWLPEHVPVFIGPLSALVIDRNQVRPDAALPSPPIGDLVGEMLNQSDNLIAELLVKEVAHRAVHAPGSTAAGLAAIGDAVRSLGVPLTGVAAD